MLDNLSDQSPYNIDCLSAPSQLDALEKEWSELIKKIPDVPIFQTWEWIKTWWVYFSENRQLCILTARDQNGRAKASVTITKEDGTPVIEAEISGVVPGLEERKVLSQMLSEGDPTNRLTDAT